MTLNMRIFSLLFSEKKTTYLGITFDPSLTFEDHLLVFKRKGSSRAALNKHLADQSWCCSFNVLRSSTIALFYVSVDDCSQAWRQNAHTHKIGVSMNEAMHTIPSCLRSTRTETTFPFLSVIFPPLLEEARRVSGYTSKLKIVTICSVNTFTCYTLLTVFARDALRPVTRGEPIVSGFLIASGSTLSKVILCKLLKLSIKMQRSVQSMGPSDYTLDTAGSKSTFADWD